MGPGVDREVRIYPTLDAASAALARHVDRSARRSVRARGRYALVVSGGRTPQNLFLRLARMTTHGWGWQDAEIFFADERCVSPGSPESNFGAAWARWLSKVPVPRRRIHRLRGELRPPGEAARRYDRWLGDISPESRTGPRFDTVLLGIGPDGHTASLFPRSSALRESRRSVVPVVRSPMAPFVPRLTLTPPALSSAEEVCFLVAGVDKSLALRRTLEVRDGVDRRRPASCVRPVGPTLWFVDRAAASRLPAPTR